ncbi:PspC domain-containing protein [Dietzia sp. PP-33]|jgi:phage shock protein PspC (stress-responsive transcriptional regulator)|uniref:PspC domain-containing protein n=1 Tax=Dietzia sp. PP-33 TaxID=2957500 RepID=UPI0029B01737|nr:PspC domain-containing protein [Dietzia sp. PP-33]MDX2356774.1 PspC domain-containing protein [Dietzia sp. PP-33]
MSSTSTTDVPSELRSLWRTRPVRTPDDAKIAGVCGGFGRRYGVDPVLFRIAFVIAALWGGAGVFLYALLWLLLRSAGDEASKGEALIGKGQASGSKVTAVALVVVVILSAPTFGGSGASFFVGAGFLMAMLAGWYGLHRRTPVPPAGWAEVSAVRPPSERAGAPGSAWTSREPGSGPSAPYGPPVPPSWDPLGAAPFAWDLPDPGVAPAPGPAPARRRSRLTKVTLGVALIAVAVAVGLSTLGGMTWLDSTRIAAIALAVVAGGLLIGAATRRGHGLLVVAGPLAGFVLLASLVQVPEGGWEGTGDRTLQITEPAQLDTPVNHEIGSVTVDMRELELDRDRSYSIANNAGEVRVLLPAGISVDSTCNADIGSVDCPDSARVDPSDPVLSLYVYNGIGSITVTR